MASTNSPKAARAAEYEDPGLADLLRKRDEVYEEQRITQEATLRVAAEREKATLKMRRKPTSTGD